MEEYIKKSERSAKVARIWCYFECHRLQKSYGQERTQTQSNGFLLRGSLCHFKEHVPSGNQDSDTCAFDGLVNAAQEAYMPGRVEVEIPPGTYYIGH